MGGVEQGQHEAVAAAGRTVRSDVVGLFLTSLDDQPCLGGSVRLLGEDPSRADDLQVVGELLQLVCRDGDGRLELLPSGPFLRHGLAEGSLLGGRESVEDDILAAGGADEQHVGLQSSSFVVIRGVAGSLRLHGQARKVLGLRPFAWREISCPS